MNQLHIYPTSRALRTVSSEHKEQDGFLPALMRMDEFEQRAILLEDKVQIDPLQRILLLIILICYVSLGLFYCL